MAPYEMPRIEYNSSVWLLSTIDDSPGEIQIPNTPQRDEFKITLHPVVRSAPTDRSETFDELLFRCNRSIWKGRVQTGAGAPQLLPNPEEIIRRIGNARDVWLAHVRRTPNRCPSNKWIEAADHDALVGRYCAHICDRSALC